MPYKIQDSAADLRERMYFPEVILGVGILMKQFLRNFFFGREKNPDVLARDRSLSQNATVQYPEEKIPYPPAYRGMHRLVPREDGKPRCVACYMCATICPAQCIYIEAGEYEDDPIEKYPVKFVIDELRCVVCGFCVEACPKDAIRMDSGEHAPPSYTRAAQIWDETRLLRGPAVSYQHDPWLRRGSRDAASPAGSPPGDELAGMRARAKPFPSNAGDEFSQTPGFSVKNLATEAKARREAKG
jgi:NADH-quinone oxidoreductase subunit I